MTRKLQALLPPAVQAGLMPFIVALVVARVVAWVVAEVKLKFDIEAFKG